MENFGIPALLSLLVPGFGQMVKRHFGKMAATWVGALLLLLNWKYKTILDGDYLITAVLYFGIVAWSVFDAYNAKTDFN